jgi:hypothetical protein
MIMKSGMSGIFNDAPRIGSTHPPPYYLNTATVERMTG